MKDYGERLMPSAAATRRDPSDLVRGGRQRRLLHRQPACGVPRVPAMASAPSANASPRCRRRATSSFSANAADYGLPSSGRTKFGYLCVEGMKAAHAQMAMRSRPPASCRCASTRCSRPTTSARIPALDAVENPRRGFYHDELNDPRPFHEYCPPAVVGKTAANCTHLPTSRSWQTPPTGSPGRQGIAGMTRSWQLGIAANFANWRKPASLLDFLPFSSWRKLLLLRRRGTRGSSTPRQGLAGPPGGQVIGGDPRPSIPALDLAPRPAGRATRWRSDQRNGIHLPQRFEGGGMRYLRFKTLAHRDQAVLDGIDAGILRRSATAGVDAAHAYGGFMAHSPHGASTTRSRTKAFRWHDQEARHRQGQREQGSDDQRRPVCGLRTCRRQRSRRHCTPALGRRDTGGEDEGPTPAYRCSLLDCSPIQTTDPEQIKRRAGATSRSWWSRPTTRGSTGSNANPVRRIGDRLYGAKEPSTWLSGRSRPWPTGLSRPHEPPTAFLRFVQGYFQPLAGDQTHAMEKLGAEPPVHRFPPDPAAIDRMLETMRWVQWLEEEQRHLVWMRAQRYPWKEICCRFAC